MNAKRLIISAIAALACAGVEASDFFSKEQPEQRLTVGVRLGPNTSVHTMRESAFNTWNADSWGVGVTAGAVVDIAIRDYISIQPGFFIDYTSGKFTRINAGWNGSTRYADIISVGDSHALHFSIPVLASMKFNITPSLRWSVDAGPYIDFMPGASDDTATIRIDNDGYPLDVAKRRDFDFGFKFGSGLTLRRHWYFGIHYMAGMLDVWNRGYGGRNKTWTFTAGYDF